MTIALKANARDSKADVEALRAEGLVPGVVYGGDREGAASFTIPYNDFERAYNQAGASTLIDLTLEGESESVKVVVQDVQYEPVKHVITHIDLKQIKMGEKMQVDVELEFTGESLAVKQGGTLVKGSDTITIECLPKDLIASVTVDLTKLETFEDSIKAGDLPLPETVTLIGDESTMIATVSAPISEEEIAAMEEAADSASVENVEVEEKGKKEEEGAEGEEKKAE